MSTAKFDTLQNAAGSKSVPVSTVVDGSAKAWVNFNGTGTLAIRAAFNVTSITDNGVGDYTMNFISAMPDANYTMGFSRQLTYNSDHWLDHTVAPYIWSTSSLRVWVGYGGGTTQDEQVVCMMIFC